MDMRLRIPELLDEKGISPYRLSKRSGDRISMSTAYRLKRVRGELDTYRRVMLDALCDVLEVEPGELWGPDLPHKRQPRATTGKPSVPKPKGKGKQAKAA